jgi:hypothetical protein
MALTGKMKEMAEKAKAEAAEAKKAREMKAEAAEKEKARKAAEAEAKKEAAAKKKAEAAKAKAEQEAKNKALLEAAKEAEAKRLEEAAKASDEEKPQAKQPEAQKVTGLTEEGKKEQEEKAEILKTKTFYNTAGHTWEISPNIQDLQYNGFQEKRAEIENLLKSVKHWDHSKNKPNQFSEGKTENWKGNGEIKIIPIKFKGHDEIQYMIFLIPKTNMDIKVLRGIRYPWDSKTGKSQAKAAGRDNREYTYEYMTTIQLKAGEAIPLGSTTNGGKAINNYGSHWANIYQVHFPKAQYGDIKNHKEIYEIDTNDLWNTTATITVKGRNGGNILRTTNMAELIGANTIHNIGYLVG